MAGSQSIQWWDHARYTNAVAYEEDYAEHTRTDTHMRADCAADISRLVPNEEQAGWSEGYNPSTEPAIQLTRRLITSQQSSINELPKKLTLFTHKVPRRVTRTQSNVPQTLMHLLCTGATDRRT